MGHCTQPHQPLNTDRELQQWWLCALSEEDLANRRGLSVQEPRPANPELRAPPRSLLVAGVVFSGVELRSTSHCAVPSSVVVCTEKCRCGNPRPPVHEVCHGATSSAEHPFRPVSAVCAALWKHQWPHRLLEALVEYLVREARSGSSSCQPDLVHLVVTCCEHAAHGVSILLGGAGKKPSLAVFDNVLLRSEEEKRRTRRRRGGREGGEERGGRERSKVSARACATCALTRQSCAR
jgi:hypothetical protein